MLTLYLIVGPLLSIVMSVLNLATVRKLQNSDPDLWSLTERSLYSQILHSTMIWIAIVIFLSSHN